MIIIYLTSEDGNDQEFRNVVNLPHQYAVQKPQNQQSLFVFIDTPTNAPLVVHLLVYQ
jgi:hypothetical protein